MRIFDFLEKSFPNWWGKTKKYGASGAVTVEIPAELYLREMAVYTAASLLANAISGCEFKVYSQKVETKNSDWYKLNIAPNKNENASLFWNKVVNRMIRSPSGALVVEIGEELHCAERFAVEERPIKGNIYKDVVLDGMPTVLNKQFTAEDAYLFRMEENEGLKYINSMYGEYGKIFSSAARAFKESNGNKYKLKLNSIKTGDEEFEKDYEEYIKKQLEAHLKNEYSVYVEYEGYELEKEEQGQAKTVDDLMKVKKDIFETVGQAFKIPASLMSGNVTSVKDVCNVFLTFGVDPYAETIQKVLNKRAGQEEVLAGNYYVVNTGKIKHRDPIEDADKIDKLISSGFASIDEVRDQEDFVAKNEWWSAIHWITKNYAKIEDVANGIAEGGENNAGNE